jgi:hypothetical protein
LRQEVLNQVAAESEKDAQDLPPGLTALWACLSELGLQIQDHTGKAFEPGQGVEVLAFEPAADLPRIIETIRPTVFLNGKKILTGLVIVGTPRLTAAE